MIKASSLRRRVTVLAVWFSALGLIYFILVNGRRPIRKDDQPALNVSQVYVLSGSDERASQMHRMLEYAKIPYKLIRGPGPYTVYLNKTVADTSLRKSFDDSWNPHGFADYFRFTMVCTLGHREIYKDAMKQGYDRILIFEDDIDIHRDMKVVLNNALHHEPSEWDILMVGYAVLDRPDQWLNSSLAGLWQPMAYASQSHAYLVKAQHLPLLLEATEDITLAPLDQILMSLLPASGALRLYGLRPPLAIQMPQVPSLLSGRAASWGRGDFGENGFRSATRSRQGD